MHIQVTFSPPFNSLTSILVTNSFYTIGSKYYSLTPQIKKMSYEAAPPFNKTLSIYLRIEGIDTNSIRLRGHQFDPIIVWEFNV